MTDKIMLADGLEKAFIGSCARTGRAIYDYNKCIHIFMTRDGMSHEEALEFMDFNVVGAYVGEGTPVFLSRCSLEAFNEANS